MEDGKYLDAYRAFLRADNVPTTLLNTLKEKVYSLGQVAYRDNEYADAKEYFGAVVEYKRSGDYLTLLACCARSGFVLSKYQYPTLIELLNDRFENTDEVILKNQVTALLFLRSRWEDGQRNNPFFLR